MRIIKSDFTLTLNAIELNIMQCGMMNLSIWALPKIEIMRVSLILIPLNITAKKKKRYANCAAQYAAQPANQTPKGRRVIRPAVKPT